MGPAPATITFTNVNNVIESHNKEHDVTSLPIKL